MKSNGLRSVGHNLYNSWARYVGGNQTLTDPEGRVSERERVKKESHAAHIPTASLIDDRIEQMLSI